MSKPKPREETAAEMRERVFARVPFAGSLRTGATPKHQMKTRIDHAIDRKRATLEDERKLIAWGTQVKVRDDWRDRYTGKTVVKTRAADPSRAEAHHIAPKADLAVRYDVRNGITLSWMTHERVERNELEIVGTRFFTVGGKRYIDATHRVVIRPVRARRQK